MKSESILPIISKGLASGLSLVKIALMSKKASPSSREGEGKGIIILGNGPSLRKTIDNEEEWLIGHDLMAVNFAALTPEFIRLRPRYYLLADPVFFNSIDRDANVLRLWENIRKVSWSMTLLIPAKVKHFIDPLIFDCIHLTVRTFNMTPVDGYKWFRNIIYKTGLGLPRPRNVMIPAIMEAIRMGYKKIYLCGADHNWTKTLDVDNENFVVSVQPHYYKDNEEELQRVRDAYKGLRLHDVLGSMVVAFRSYWNIADFAERNGVEIINATPGSMIDAFKRR